MLMNMTIGFAVMTTCLMLQTALLIAAFRYYVHHTDLLDSPSVLTSLFVINAVMAVLVAGNLGQIAVWGLLFVWLGEFQSFSEAFYHSAVNFATLGYGDIVMSPAHRLLGPLEAINGVLMFGVSTATLMAALQDATKRMINQRRSRK
tara:strand:+ start:274 stop:714 length:441 start_codon:yes stop_codon:yes gene_type:complete